MNALEEVRKQFGMSVPLIGGDGTPDNPFIISSSNKLEYARYQIMIIAAIENAYKSDFNIEAKELVISERQILEKVTIKPRVVFINGKRFRSNWPEYYFDVCNILHDYKPTPIPEDRVPFASISLPIELGELHNFSKFDFKNCGAYIVATAKYISPRAEAEVSIYNNNALIPHKLNEEIVRNEFDQMVKGYDDKYLVDIDEFGWCLPSKDDHLCRAYVQYDLGRPNSYTLVSLTTCNKHFCGVTLTFGSSFEACDVAEVFIYEYLLRIR